MTQATDIIEAPWTQAQVDTLNQYQSSGVFHPFTCGRRDHPSHSDDNPIDRGALEATVAGWVCRECGYTQNWVQAWIANGKF